MKIISATDPFYIGPLSPAPTQTFSALTTFPARCPASASTPASDAPTGPATPGLPAVQQPGAKLKNLARSKNRGEIPKLKTFAGTEKASRE